MKCHSCGYENADEATYCHECGVNLKKRDSKKNAEVLDRKFRVVNKRQSYPTPPENSGQAKLLYKHDRHTGRLRLAKTKCATIVVFCAFTIFGLIVSSITSSGIATAVFVALMFGALFAIPVAVIGFVIGYIIDKIFH